MNSHIKFSPSDLNENVFKLLDKDWMLITAGEAENYNTMTASWGGFGVLWNKPVAFIFIRPQRHTFSFTERCNSFTLSFFDERYREALNFCGSKSGRDYDKAKETGLTPLSVNKNVAFAESRLILECTKLYLQDINPEGFIDKELIAKIYPSSDFHRMYVGEIVNAYKHI